MTPAQLRQAADEAEADASATELEASKMAAAMRDQAVRLRALADELEAKGLPVTTASSSMLRSKMELQNERVNKRVKIAATMTTGATEAKRALLEAGLTPQDVATARKVGRSTVDAWCRGTRSIPRADRDWLKSRYGIPLRVWKKQAE
jgi:DNA-binding transcriptional regulator YiaG